MYIIKYHVENVFPGFRGYSLVYCYISVLYGQEMTALISQRQRMTVNFIFWLYYANDQPRPQDLLGVSNGGRERPCQIVI